MFWYIVTELLTLCLDVLFVHFNPADRDLEILALRQQIRILERKLGHQPRISRWEKCLLAVLTLKLLHQVGKVRQQLSNSLWIFKPETVLGWHKALVRRKWTFK